MMNASDQELTLSDKDLSRIADKDLSGIADKDLSGIALGLLPRLSKLASISLSDNNMSALLSDAHAIPQLIPTHLQLTLFVAYCFLLLLLLARALISFLKIKTKLGILQSKSSSSNRPHNPSPHHDDNSGHGHSHTPSDVEIENGSDQDGRDGDFVKVPLLNQCSHGAEGAETASDHSGSSADTTRVTVGHNGLTENLSERRHSNTNRHQPHKGGNGNDPTAEPIKSSGSVTQRGQPPAVTFDKFLLSCAIFGVMMALFYVSDYMKLLPQGEREYSRDLFLFLVFLFFLVACAYTIKDNPDKVLNRDQTEEWKGWMQVMFVWYHYFKAKEWYNWIRIYIACYVWMTGFGNFSFFWIRKDFSMWRMLKMLFRLNFLVIFVSMVTNNEYMLYYICAMHTYWFFTVYVFMRVLNSWNTDRIKMAVKFTAYAIFNAVIFDIPGVSQKVFRPLHFILGLNDDKGDIMHEWSFRAGLDHWACFVGMLCAYNYPHFEAFMAYLDAKPLTRNETLKKLGIRIGMGVGAIVLGTGWYVAFMRKEKYAYNALHPYTSPIPILVFIVLRNIHPSIRVKHIGMFAWLGKITLETYISQLHIYLVSNARTLLEFLPSYPLLNFAVATIVYLFCSHTLFGITNDASNFLIPRDRKQLLLRIVGALALFGVSSVIAYSFSFESKLLQMFKN